MRKGVSCGRLCRELESSPFHHERRTRPLLTDIVDSTRLWETLGDAAMGELWSTHDRVARNLIPVWRGREVDKSDGLLLLFATAADAVRLCPRVPPRAGVGRARL